MASILTLPGYVNIVSMKDGEVALTFDGKRFARDEILPSSLLTSMTGPEQPCTAGKYVEHCMSRQFGDDKMSWPPLAMAFLAGLQAD